MRFLAGSIIAILFCVIFRVLLRKAPIPFYILAGLLSTLLIVADQLPMSPWFREYFLFLFQSNTLGMGFFTIVMFIGVFSESHPIRKALQPIRAELSILAALLSIGHLFKYGQVYLDQMLSPTSYVPTIRYWMIGVAIVLIVLLIPLTITSFKHIHAAMNKQHWKILQRFAYLFFGSTFLHIVLCLWVPSVGGSSSALISMVLYVLTGSLYVILRLYRYFRSRRARQRKVDNAKT